MSAETLGRDLLSDVKEESLDVLLRSLREQFPPTTSQLGVPALDRLLDIFEIPVRATAQTQQPQHTQWSTQATAPEPPPTKERRPPVVEITGVSACSGKTQLLYHIIAVTLLPILYHGVPLQGKEQAVVLLDLSNKFSILRLRDLMYGYVVDRSTKSGSTLSGENITLLIHNSLTHLHVFHPHSTPNLLTTLTSLPAYLLSRPSTHFSANRPLGLLAIQEIGNFYQQDRFESEESQAITTTTTTTTTNTNTNTNSTNLLQTRYQNLTTLLQKTQLLFSSTPLLATNTALSSPSPSSSNQTPSNHPSLRPHLPAIWNNYCTLQLVVERDRVTKFSPGVSVEEASAERGARWDAVSRSGFSGWINWWGCGGWREEVRVGLRRMSGGGRFGFRVKGGRVLVGDGGGDGDGDEEGGEG